MMERVLFSFTGVLASSADPFKKVSEPVIKLINSAAGPALGIVGAIGMIYCILLGAKLAKAEEPQDREKAKAALKNAIIGFVLIFVLMMALTIGLPAMVEWLNQESPKMGISISMVGMYPYLNCIL